jgi:hypothetical protein
LWCEIAITDSELSAWEALEADAWLCGGCLTDAEVAAIGDDAMEMAERDRCVRCGRDRSGQRITEEELDNWIVTSDGRNICAACQIPEDQIADTERTIADLDQFGVIQRGGTPMPRKRSLTPPPSTEPHGSATTSEPPHVALPPTQGAWCVGRPNNKSMGATGRFLRMFELK